MQLQILLEFSHFQSAKFLALMSDRSTDTSSSETEILFMQSKGVVKTNFIGIQFVPKADVTKIVKGQVGW